GENLWGACPAERAWRARLVRSRTDNQENREARRSSIYAGNQAEGREPRHETKLRVEIEAEHLLCVVVVGVRGGGAVTGQRLGGAIAQRGLLITKILRAGRLAVGITAAGLHATNLRGLFEALAAGRGSRLFTPDLDFPLRLAIGRNRSSRTGAA